MFLITLFVFIFLKLKESEQTMDTLNTKRETQIVKSSVVDIPRVNSFPQTLTVALLRLYRHLKKTISVVQVLTAIYFVIVCAYFTLLLSLKL